ncbi:MAG TPA: protein kinase, partial [Pseudonocardia sp.]|nr:protein kinase [Pseudonocardia sp.]
HFEGPPMHLHGRGASTAGMGLYLVMNWVAGLTLQEWALVNRVAPDRVPQLLRHLRQVANVLDWLHSGAATPSGREVIHGDLSPGNVMIDPHGQATLVDFGLVRVVSHRTARAAGTPGYTAPEVLRNGEYSPESDRFSFGALTFYGLTGQAPPQDLRQVRAALTSHGLLSNAREEDVALVMSIFSDQPGSRPKSLVDWMDLLRDVGTTVYPITVPDPSAWAATAAGALTPWSSSPHRGRRTGRQLLMAGLVVLLVAAVGVFLGAMLVRSQIPSGSTATPTLTPQKSRQEASPSGSAPEPTSQAEAGSTTAAPTAAPPSPVTYSPRFAPVQFVASSQFCSTSSPNYELAIPKAGVEDSLADFHYYNCAGDNIEISTANTQVALLDRFAQPDPRSCIDALERREDKNGSHEGQAGLVICFRKTSSGESASQVHDTISAIRVDSVKGGLVTFTAYSWAGK